MSLRVWLPLNGTLDNKGLDQVTVINNGATVDNNGKIEKCYSFGASSYLKIPLSKLSEYSTTAFSMCLWAKVPSPTSGNKQLLHIGKGSGWANNRFTILYQGSTTVSRIVTSISDGSSYGAYSCYADIPIDTWIHIASVFDNRKLKLYINGELKNTYNTTYDLSFTSIEALGIGGAPNGAELLKSGYINDVRIYDHALSPLEVKQISQGLILHYPLNRNGWGQENLLPCGGLYTYNSPWTVTTNRTDGYSLVTNSAFEATPSTTYTISVQCDGTLTSFHGRGNIPITDKPFAFWLYICNVDTTKSWSTGQYDSAVILTSENHNYRKIGNTHVWTYTLSSNQKYISLRTNSYSDGSNNITINWWNMKIEKGDKFTPWCPNSADELYNTLKLNDNIQYDTSGYGNNGIRTGTFNWTSDTPKYNVSTGITAGGGIFTPINITFSQYTIAFWAKHTVSSKMLMGSCPSADSTQTSWYWYGDNSFKYPSGEYYYTYNGGAKDSFKWTHFVATYDGTNVRVYRNGVSEGSKTCTGNQVMAYLSVGYGYGSRYIEDSNMSDFRIYTTALSADDVKSLYNNSAYIDNQGNIYGAVYEEV